MAQAPDWTRVLQVNSNSAPSVSQVTSDVNNVYMTCKVGGPITFEGISYTNIGINDLLLAKISNAGVTEWVKQFNAEIGGSITSNAIKVDASGNIYVAATFIGTITSGGNPINSSTTINSIFVKFDASGKRVWATPFLSTGTGSSKIALDASGNSFLISKSSKLLKFNTSGSLAWEQIYPNKTLQAIGILGSDLFIGGALQQRATTFGAFNLLVSNVNNTGFLVKADLNGEYNKSLVEGKLALSTKENIYKASGTFNHPTSGIRKINVTKKLTGVEENVLSTSVGDLDITQGTLLLTINYDNTVTVIGSISATQPIFQSGPNLYDPVNKVFTLNYSYEGSGGTRIISETLTISTIIEAGSAISDIAFDSNGNLIITGDYNKDLELGAIIISNTSQSNYTYIAKCDNNFSFAWAKSSSRLLNPNREIYSYQIFLDNSNNIYEIGMSNIPITFGTIQIVPGAMNQFLFEFDSNGNTISGNGLPEADFDLTSVNQSGKVLAGNNSGGNFSISQYSNNLSQEWQKGCIGSKSGTAMINSIKHDATGNTYLQTRVTGNCDYFGTIINSAIPVTVISKHDSEGKLLWMNQIADISPDLFGPIFILDKDNNILTVGLFQTSLNIGTTTLTSTNFQYEAYAAKYNSDGVFLWAAKMNLSADVSTIITIAADNAGNVIVTGVIDPANYLVKFDANGNQLWAKSFPMESRYIAMVSTDGNNNIYLTSEIHLSDASGSTTIGSIPLTQTKNDGSTALIKFDANGNALWAKTYGGSAGLGYSDGWACDIKTDASGNTYLWGWCVNNAVFGAFTLTNPIGTGYSLYLSKINTEGEVLWANAVYEKMNGFNYGDLLDLDKNGNVYIGGHFKDRISIEGIEYVPEGFNDFFAIKYSNAGIFQWIKTIPANYNIINALSLKDNDVLSVAGFAGINSTLGSFNISRLSGSNCMVATLGNLTTGIKETNISNISVFPNPVSSTLFLSGLTQNSTVSVFDLSGKLLINKSVLSNQIDVSKLTNGFYTIRIVDKNGITSKVFVKQ